MGWFKTQIMVVEYQVKIGKLNIYKF